MIDFATATDAEIRAHADGLMPALEAFYAAPKRGKAEEEHRARVGEVEACYDELWRRRCECATPEQLAAWSVQLHRVAEQSAPRGPKAGGA